MKCDLCNSEKSKRYIAFPEKEHLTEEIQVLYLCKRCRSAWHKVVSSQGQIIHTHWILRSTTFVPKLVKIPLTPEQEEALEISANVDFPLYKTIGYLPDEEDLSI